MTKIIVIYAIDKEWHFFLPRLNSLQVTLKIVSVFLIYEDVCLSRQIQDFELGEVCFSSLYFPYILISLDSLMINPWFLPMKVENGNKKKEFRDYLVRILPGRKPSAGATG